VALKRERAFVLSVVPLKEKDRIVTFLTEESGKKRGVARGARRLQSAFSGSLEPMSEAEIGYYEKEGKDLHRIESVDLVRSSFPLSSEIGSALLLSALAESLETFVSDSDPAERFCRLARHCMDALFSGADAKKVSAYFDVWILKLTGVLPPISECASCGEALGRGPVFLDDALPGFVGRECARPGAVRLSREFPATLSAVLSRRIADLPAGASALSELSRVTGQLRRHFLGHELKSQRVLAEIW
jgi:DNA repair protein RecO (recombination protein O)